MIACKKGVQDRHSQSHNQRAESQRANPAEHSRMVQEDSDNQRGRLLTGMPLISDASP
jgi:hypothetical protein